MPTQKKASDFKPLKRTFTSVLEKRLKEDAPLIQVILGPRQVGKTTGVEMLSGFTQDIHYATADDALSEPASWIDRHWQEAKLKSQRPILVLDEIQKVLHWSDKIKALWDAERRRKNSFRLILLGSSALGLVRGMEESLTGRFEVIHVPHWSFDESHRAFGFDLDSFLLYGGYPKSADFVNDFARWQSYLRNSIIETVIGKDILRLGTVRKPALFRQTFQLLAAYPAQQVSYTKLLGQLQESGNVELVKHYIDLFEGAFLFKALQKFSGSTVRQRASSPKILPLCPALFNYQAGLRDLANPDIRGRVIEAAVGAELAKTEGELFYWRESDKEEVDFVLSRGKEILAVEVKSGRKKPTRGLGAFIKAYPKAKSIFVSPENFPLLSKNPEEFIQRALS